ncbi:hypothetical protein IV203_037791 [Nitzschia inconspicua]|uniref:Uncharacterized protein n=1 Tax=Nitzschia inconspicua TaxID=303405 RepID=A0A9K3KN45_9STRA|nr:hypothetical protein IV203_005859 [Nitzschia inconspicua]KAG7364589.1 hypothetical protein IV203_037791 [Nitzschia inconspicua]
MGQSASSHSNHQQHRYGPEQPSPYASAVVRKTADFESTNGGLKRASGQHSLSSTLSSSHRGSSNSTASSSNGATRYIPNMKGGSKGLVMPRGGAPLHSVLNAPPADPSTGGYASPDSWGFHINITPTQELYAANSASQVPCAAPMTDGKRNQVFQNLQSSNKTNMGWTSFPI